MTAPCEPERWSFTEPSAHAWEETRVRDEFVCSAATRQQPRCPAKARPRYRRLRRAGTAPALGRGDRFPDRDGGCDAGRLGRFRVGAARAPAEKDAVKVVPRVSFAGGWQAACVT